MSAVRAFAGDLGERLACIPMTPYLIKVLTALTLPLGVALLLGAAALLMLGFGRRRFAAALLTFQLLLLWGCSLPWLDYRISAWLEADYPRVALERTPVADVAVVLGGGVGLPGDPPAENLNGAADRVLRTARLYKSGKVGQVLAVGGNLDWLGEGPPEADLTRELLVEWGVPAEAVVTETHSRNTRENARNAAAIIRERGWQRVLLVTSAAHMRRAVASFAEAGVTVIPSPTDYIVIGPLVRDPLDFLPDAGALGGVSAGVREILGRFVQHLRGA